MLVFAFVALAASAQIGDVRITNADTITNTGVVTSDVIQITSNYNALTIQAVYTQLTGTSAGSAVLKASVDGTSYITINNADGMVKGWPNDTVTITNGAIYDFVIKDVPFKYYKLVSTGSGTSTTRVVVKYILK